MRALLQGKRWRMAALIVRPGDRRLEPLHGSITAAIKMQYLRDDDPYVHLTEVAPRHVIEPHRHSETEVTVILSGSARLGDTVCEAGTVLVIPADEEYGLVAGDDGLTFLVVRPRRARYTPADRGGQAR